MKIRASVWLGLGLLMLFLIVTGYIWHEQKPIPTSTLQPAREGSPNIVLIHVDDLGYSDVGFNGATRVKTPNIDRIAKEGIIFTNGYAAAAACSPSRAGLLTGRYPARFGMDGNLAYMPFDPYHGLPLEETTFVTHLQNAGYRTGLVGKWHLGAASHFNPRKRGFDYFFGFLGGAHGYWGRDVDLSKPSIGAYTALIENTDPVWLEDDDYLTDVLTDRAIAFIKKQPDTPFFLYLAYNAPHRPLAAPGDLVLKYRHIEDERHRTYLAMVDSMDSNVGRVLGALEESGRWDNTIVFFLSDNGGLEPKIEGYSGITPQDNRPLRGGKGWHYEGGVRVPFIASWPLRWPQGETYEPMVISLDIAATILAQVGITVNDTERPLDGIDLDPFLRGEVANHPHEALFWRYGRFYAVRSGDLKLIRLRNRAPALFNLQDDISEMRNLINEEAKAAARLASLWNEWNKENIGHIYMGVRRYENRMNKLIKDFNDSIRRETVQTPFQINEESIHGSE